MNTPQDLEDRVALLEKEVQHLRLQLARQRGDVSGRTAPDFLDKFAGIFADDPTFDEAVRIGREWRNANRPEDETRGPDAEAS